MKNWLLQLPGFVFNLVLHLLAIVGLFFAYLPLASWYIKHPVILGVDFYNMVANAAYYARHLEPRFAGFKSISWAGFPYWLDYPSLHNYLIFPLVNLLGAQQAVLYYGAIALFLLALGCYFLFWMICKNQILSLVLAVFCLYSLGVWGPLIWGGGMQYVATMFFLPFSAAFLVLYLNGRSRKGLLISAILAGISILGHPQIMFSYIAIFAIILLLFGYFKEIKASLKRRLIDLVIFFGIAGLIAYVQLQTFLGQNILLAPVTILNYFNPILRLFSSSGSQPEYGYVVPANVPAETARAIAEYNKAEFWRFQSDIHPGFFVLIALGVGLLLISLIFTKNRLRVLGILPFLLFIGFLFVFNFALSRGVSFFQGGWFRAFWPLPMAFGVLIAYCYLSFWSGISERIVKLENLAIRSALVVVLSALVGLVGWHFWQQHNAEQFTSQLDVIKYRQKSGAFPDALNKPLNSQQFLELATKLVPTWLPKDDQQFRIYTADQKVNIWWPTFFEMPLFRGYIDVSLGSPLAGGFFWTDIALAQTQGRDILVEDFKTPKEIAKNNALFLIDWYSIGYFEGGHDRSESFNPPASYLTSDKNIFEKEEEVIIPGYAKVHETKSGQIEWIAETNSLRFLKFKDGLVSPIASAANTATIGVVGSDASYETILRVLAMTNTNSRQLVPLWLTDSLAKLPDLDSLNLDMLILYGYRNGDNQGGWKKVEKYLKQGGKVLVETGSDVAQTNSLKLPSFFPIEGTKKGQIGNQWGLTRFSPPLLDDSPWLFSLPTGIKDGAEVILRVDQTPLWVKGSFDKGLVIWSGMNLFYHTNVHKNLEEGEFIKSQIAQLLSLEEKESPYFQVEFVNNQKIKIKTKDARATLLRQQFYDGWQAKVNGERQRIFATGPTYPGFMYVKIPEKFAGKDIIVEYSFQGDFWTLIYTILTMVVLLLSVDYLLGARIINLGLVSFKGSIWVKVTQWWKREDE